MKKSRLVLVLGLGGVAGLALYLGQAPDSKPLSAPSVETTSAHSADVVANLSAPQTGRSVLAHLPRSIRNIDHDGGFELDDQNNLIAGKSIKRWFDYLFSTLGEWDLPTIMKAMEEQTEALPEPARSQARDAFKRYMDYKKAVTELEAQSRSVNPLKVTPEAIPDLEERLNALHELRQSWLGPELADAFYAEQEAVDNYTLAKLKIMNDGSLPDAERVNRLTEISSLLPESIRASREMDTKRAWLEAKVEEIQSRGGEDSEAEVFQLRQLVLGPEKAQQLAELDRERNEFNARLADYRKALAALDLDGLSASARQARVQSLREAHFSGTELKKVAALDKLGLDKY